MNTYIRTKSNISRSRFQSGVSPKATTGVLTPTLAGYRNSTADRFGYARPYRQAPATREECASTMRKRSLSPTNQYASAGRQIPMARMLNSVKCEFKNNPSASQRNRFRDINRCMIQVIREGPMFGYSSPHIQEQRSSNFSASIRSNDMLPINSIRRRQDRFVAKKDRLHSAPSRKHDLSSLSKKTDIPSSPEKAKCSPVPSRKDDVSSSPHKTGSRPSSQKNNYLFVTKMDDKSQACKNSHPTPSQKVDLSPMLENTSSRPSSGADDCPPGPKIVYGCPPLTKGNYNTSPRKDEPSLSAKKVDSQPPFRKEDFSSAPAKGDSRSLPKNNKDNYFFTGLMNNNGQKTPSEGSLDSMDDIPSWGNQDDTLHCRLESVSPPATEKPI